VWSAICVMLVSIRSSADLVSLNCCWLEELLWALNLSTTAYTAFCSYSISSGRPCSVAVTDKSKKRRLPSDYADIRKKLPSASGMDLTIMRLRQGVVTANDITKEPQLQDVDSPLYMNYRCSAHQVSCARICKITLKKLVICGLQVNVSILCDVLTKIWQSSLYVQVPIKLLHPVFGKFEHLAETVQPSLASLNFLQTLCAQAKYYYASEEKDYQQVMRSIWKHVLSHLGRVSCPTVGRNSTPGLALMVSASLIDSLLLASLSYK